LASNLDLGRDFGYIAAEEQQIEALTTEQVRAAWQRYIDPKRLVIIRAGDFK
jgi:zinc protease